MTKLTKIQRLVLHSACSHEMGLATRPESTKPAQATKIAALLIDMGFAKEIRAKAGAPIWREDEQGRVFTLKILKAGREAIASSDSGEAALAIKQMVESQTAVVEETASKPAIVSASVAGPKSIVIVGLMQRAEGATIDDLIAATGWLPHTTRAALSGLRKKGLLIERDRAEQGGGSVYRIVEPRSSMAA